MGECIFDSEELLGPYGRTWTLADIGSLHSPDPAFARWVKSRKKLQLSPPRPNPGSASEL